MITTVSTSGACEKAYVCDMTPIFRHSDAHPLPYVTNRTRVLIHSTTYVCLSVLLVLDGKCCTKLRYDRSLEQSLARAHRSALFGRSIRAWQYFDCIHPSIGCP